MIRKGKKDNILKHKKHDIFYYIKHTIFILGPNEPFITLQTGDSSQRSLWEPLQLNESHGSRIVLI